MYLLAAVFITTASSLPFLSYLLTYDLVYERWKSRALIFSKSNSTEADRFVGTGGSETSMLTMGSIFIAASFIILAFSNQKGLDPGVRVVMAIFSPILYAMWLFSIQLSTRLMMDAKIEVELIHEHGPQRIDLIEHHDLCWHNGPAHMRRRFYGAKNGKGLMMKVRRNHWLLYLTLLTFPSMVTVWFSFVAP